LPASAPLAIYLSAQPIDTKRDALLMFRLSRIDRNADLTDIVKTDK
jgi:hypothetical protein